MTRTFPQAVFTVCSLIFGFHTVSAQMLIDNTMTPTELVEEILLGEGVLATNITFSGNPQQIGMFDASNGVFPLTEGVVMSTGNVADVAAAANSFASTGFGTAGDPDLAAISGGLIRDAAILEFDFIPTGDSINFSYVFASEEYPNFCCGQFNDVFAFLISGPGFNGPYTNNAENIALLPGTTTPVSISTVNNGTANNGPCTNCEYYVNNATGGTNGVAFNAHTVVLQALAQVQCGETYRIKLAIADVADNIYDSGVFLEARSFSSNALEIEIATISADSSITPGCTNATITMTRPDADTTLVIPVLTSGSAVNGVDYTGVPETVLFLPGQTTISFDVVAVDDGLPNSQQDTIILTVFTVNLCGDSVETVGVIFIKEDYDIDVSLSSELVACSDLYGYSQISSTVSGGNPPYFYQWSNGETTPGIAVAPPVESSFTVTVTDSCGFVQQVASITVPASVSAPSPEVSTSNDVTLSCPGQTATLTAIASGGTQPYNYAWNNGMNGSQITVSPSQSTDFVVAVTDACFPGPVRDTIRVTVLPYTPPVVEVTDVSVACPGTDLPVNLGIEGGNEPFSILWSNGLSGASNVLNPTEDETITVTLTDACGTESIGSFAVTVPQYAALQASVRDTFLSALDTLTICELWSDTVWAAVAGGLAPYVYSWEGTLVQQFSASNDSVAIVVPYELPGDSSVAELYTLNVTDQCGETTSVELTVNVINCDIVQPNVFNAQSTHNGGADFCGVVPQNNVFHLPCLNLYPGNKVTIFDRWGRKTYQADNYHNNPWDGGSAADGVFFYIVEVPGRADVIQGYFHKVSGGL
jgi:hypothetical protein